MEDMVLGRIGHYFTPNSEGGGFCQTAIVVDVLPSPASDAPLRVNLAGWEHDGDPFRHLEVPVDVGALTGASFHLNRGCKWGR